MLDRSLLQPSTSNPTWSECLLPCLLLSITPPSFTLSLVLCFVVDDLVVFRLLYIYLYTCLQVSTSENVVLFLLFHPCHLVSGLVSPPAPSAPPCPPQGGVLVVPALTPLLPLPHCSNSWCQFLPLVSQLEVVFKGSEHSECYCPLLDDLCLC